MKRFPGLALACMAVAIVAAGAATSATAQDYPSRPIKLVVPLGPGGVNDVFARIIGQYVGPILKATIVVENRPGAGGRTGARFVAAAEPDGYTLLMANTAVLANIPAFSKDAGYDPVESFAPVAKITETVQALVAKSDFPPKTLSDFIAYAKARPGKLNYASSGAGNLTHLSGELLKQRAGIDLVHLPYRSANEAVTAVLSDQAQVNFSSISFVLPQIREGQLKALAVTGSERDPELPDVAALNEVIPGLSITSFFGIVAPAATPAPIVERLSAAINQALKSPEMAARLQKIGIMPSQSTPTEFAAFIKSELDKWKAAAKSSSITID
jgi:tripartite-type tricarboxylate transporter receptor subunit TctC